MLPVILVTILIVCQDEMLVEDDGVENIPVPPVVEIVIGMRRIMLNCFKEFFLLNLWSCFECV